MHVDYIYEVYEGANLKLKNHETYCCQLESPLLVLSSIGIHKSLPWSGLVWSGENQNYTYGNGDFKHDNR